MNKKKLSELIGLSILLSSSTALAGVTPVDPYNGVSSVTISPQHSNGSGDLTGTNYGYANGLEQFAYNISINYAGAVSDDQISVDFTQGITIDIEVPNQGGIKHMHLKMPTNDDTCLNEGQYIYPGFSETETTFSRSSYNGLKVSSGATYPDAQGNNWHCSNESESNCTLFHNSQDVIGNMDDVNQARVCLTNTKNKFSNGVDSGTTLNATLQANQLANSSKETRVIYIQAADIPEGAYVVGLTYTDDSNHTIVVNENSGAEYLNIMYKPRLTIAPVICYKNSKNYGTHHHEHPGLEYRDYYIVNPNPNSSIQYMPIFMDVLKRESKHDSPKAEGQVVWNYDDLNVDNIVYSYDVVNNDEQYGSRIALNKSFEDDKAKAFFVTRNHDIGTGGNAGTINHDKDFVAYTAKNIITKSIYPNQNYINLMYWGSMDSDDATNNDQDTLPQTATTVISIDQFGNTYKFDNQSLLNGCSQ
jgi:hypothetical protein